MKTYIITTAFIRRGDKFLIAKRSATKKFAPNQWEFISGFMDAPECAENVILKELKEELKAEGKIIDFSGTFEFNDTEGRWIIVPFLIELDSQDIQMNSADHSNVKWVTMEELKNYPDLNQFLDNAGVQKLLRIQREA